MGIFDTFSKRKKRSEGPVADVYIYNSIPVKVRNQIILILRGFIEAERLHLLPRSPLEIFTPVVNTLKSELGVLALPGSVEHGVTDDWTAFNVYLSVEEDVDKLLDAIEVMFVYVSEVSRGPAGNAAILELNTRFKEASIGYEFVNGQIVRMDSELIHSEVVKPALVLLARTGYEGAQEEFLSAHKHHREGRDKEAIVDCLKAFESTIKSICKIRKWNYNKNATAKDLVAICFQQGLIPSYWQNLYNHLIEMLISGVPTGRNKTSGHGQGPTPIDVPDGVTAYVLNMTAASIVFLAESESALP